MSEEFMTVAQAREYLGIGKRKMADLIKEGTLQTRPDPLDERVKLIPRSDVEALKERSGKKLLPAA